MSIGESISLTQTRKRQKFEDNDFKWITTWWFQEIVMAFFMEHIMAYLDDAFMNKQRTGLEKYK
jgi:hypothetical protein